MTLFSIAVRVSCKAEKGVPSIRSVPAGLAFFLTLWKTFLQIFYCDAQIGTED